MPATADAIANYLASYAGLLSTNTLRQRLAALGRWHAQHGFSDPTRDDLVRRALRGIRALHGVQHNQATPLQIEDLERVVDTCEQNLVSAKRHGDRRGELLALRDRALVLLGFWRAFRSDELARVQIEHVTLREREGMTIFLPSSKGDRQNLGRTYAIPAPSRLCPVEALSAWLDGAGLTQGAAFRGITRWGTIGESALHPGSIVPLMRTMLANAGVSEARSYSSHSLRRGLAGWATVNGWDLKTLMQYVGWRDIKTAPRCVDAATDDRERIEASLEQMAPSRHAASVAKTPAASPQVTLELALKLSSYAGKTRAIAGSRRHIEEICLARYGGQRFGRDGTRYQITMGRESQDGSLDDRIGDLLDELHRIASNNECYLEVSFKDAVSGQCWD